jgi:hypothetical protein
MPSDIALSPTWASLLNVRLFAVRHKARSFVNSSR